MSNSLDPDQAEAMSGPIWVQTVSVCKSYKQKTMEGEEGLYKLVKMLLANIIKLSVKDLIRTSFFFI